MYVMGAIHSNYTWYVYSRDLERESWNKQPLLTFDKKNLGAFKHLVWRFALQDGESFETYKAIYLYQGSTRYVKAELIRPTTDAYYKLEMEFKNKDWADAWDTVDEAITDTKILWKEKEFKKHYVPLDQYTQTWVRRWQLVKPIPNTKPGIPKLSLIQYIKTTLQE